jgi:hypothetical protein
LIYSEFVAFNLVKTEINLNYTVHVKETVSRIKHAVLDIQTCQLMLYKKIFAVCCEIHPIQINNLCGQNAGFVNVKESNEGGS